TRPADAADPQEPLGPGEAVDEPARGDPSDPGADERDALPADEQPVIAVPQRPRRAAHSAGPAPGSGMAEIRHARCWHACKRLPKPGFRCIQLAFCENPYSDNSRTR